MTLLKQGNSYFQLGPLRDYSAAYSSRRTFALIEEPLQPGSNVGLVSLGCFECRVTGMEDMWETRVTANSSLEGSAERATA